MKINNSLREFHLSLSLLGTVLFYVSCSYPEARLIRKTDSGGLNTLAVVYPSVRKCQISTAWNGTTGGVFFRINDFTELTFIPYAPDIDNRWFYYFGTVDGECIPLQKNPVLFGERKNTEERYPGPSQALFPEDGGFIAVYADGKDFMYARFGPDGTVKEKHTVFYQMENFSGEKSRVLSIAFSGNNLCLMVLNPPVNIYADLHSVDMVQRDIAVRTTRITRNIIPEREDSYYIKNMSSLVSGDTLYLAWISGQRLPGDSGSVFYRLSSVFYAARGALGDSLYDPVRLHESEQYNDADVELIREENQVLLIMSDSVSARSCVMNGAGWASKAVMPVQREKRTPFGGSGEFPCPVIFSAEVTD